MIHTSTPNVLVKNVMEERGKQMTLRDMIEQSVTLQGNIDITIFGEDDLTITSNYENCDKLSLNQLAKRHRDLEITHIYCEDGRLQIDLKENK